MGVKNLQLEYFAVRMSHVKPLDEQAAFFPRNPDVFVSIYLANKGSKSSLLTASLLNAKGTQCLAKSI